MRAGSWITAVLAASALATTTVLASAAIAGGDDDGDYRTEIIDNYVNRCAVAVVHKNPETRSIPDDDIALVIRTASRHGLEMLLDLWIPKVKAMTETERHSFYEDRLEWCITTDLGTRPRERVQDMAKVVDSDAP